METVIIQRLTDNGIQTTGQLYSKNFSCNTLEKPWKNNERNVSCIPKGCYFCKMTPSKFGTSYLVLNVVNRSSILFHKGNYHTDIEGCILLGSGYTDLNKDGQVDIINSTITLEKFENFLAKKDFLLIIQ